jgi:ankyrin repeat protein
MLNLKRKETLSEDFAQSAETGDVESLKSTIAAGVDVDTANIFGTTALMRASSRGDVEMVRVLLSYGADPNRVRNDKFSALALAAFFGHQNVVKCLVEHGADANASTRFGTSPEMWANARTFRSVAKYLGDKGNAPAQITTRAARCTKATAGPRTPKDDPATVNSAPVAVDDCSAKDDEHIPRTFSTLRLSLRVALSSAVLLFVVAVTEVVIEHRQAPPATVNQSPQLNTGSIPVSTAIEQTVPEPSQPVNTSANLNHAEDLGGRNSSPAKSHNRISQRRAQDSDADETSASIPEEPKIKTDVSPRESIQTPITVSRPVSSKPAASTSQLISPPANEKTKGKVIQWP